MADLGSLLNELVMQTGGATAPSAIALPQAANAQKTQLKTQMTGLASTQTGIDILTQIVNNASVDIVERTAAAEILNPGTLVNFNQDGSVSFDSPQSKIAFNPTTPNANSVGMAEGQKVETQIATNNKIATVPELMQQVNAGLAQVQSEKDPLVIINSLGNLSQSIADFSAARTTQLRDESRRLFGIDAFEQQIQTDKQLDMQESQEVFGVEYMGMSEASQATMAQYQMAVGKADEWYKTQLATDPALAAIGTKAKYLEDFAQSRLKTLGETSELSQVENLVDPTSIDATLIAIGREPTSATPEERRQISLQIQSGNGYYTKAQELGMRDNQLPIFLSNGGTEAQMAKNVLTYKAGGNKALVDEMVNAYNNFEVFTGMTPEQMEAQGLSPSTKIDEKSILAGNNKESRERAEAGIKLARWNFIRQQYNQQATSKVMLLEGFDSPQSASLGEFDSFKNSLATARQSSGDTNPVTLADVVQRMQWPADKLEVQKKEDELADYILSQAQKHGNGVIGMPDQFANRNLVKSFIQTNRIQAIVRDKQLFTSESPGQFARSVAMHGPLGIPIAGILTALGPGRNLPKE